MLCFSAVPCDVFNLLFDTVYGHVNVHKLSKMLEKTFLNNINVSRSRFVQNYCKSIFVSDAV